MSAPSIRAQDLLSHSEWVRRLARGLVADEAAAADLIQDTWTAALRQPRGSVRAWRPWLASTLRRLAWRRHREAERRTDRETLAARPEPVPPESDAVERLETQRALVDTLLALEEPLRSTLVERYIEERSSADIARRHGVPAGTVRWRVKRGLERLREILDERHGGQRDAWILALVPLALPPVGGVPIGAAPDSGVAAGSGVESALGGTIATGVLAMNATLKIALVAALLLATAIGWGLLSEEPARPDELAAAAPENVAANAELRAVARVESIEQVPTDLAVVEKQTHAREAASSEQAPPLEEEPTHVHARFLDEWGRVQVGVRLVVQDEGEDEDGALAVSDVDGRVALQVNFEAERHSRRIDLRAVGAGFATRSFRVLVQRGEPAWLGDVVLQPGGRVVGLVVDEHLRPIAAAEVQLVDPELPPGEPEFLRLQGPFMGSRGRPATTDASGRFTFDGASIGPLRVWARADGMRWTFSEPGEVWSDVDMAVELVLEPLADGERIAGVVLDPEGEPFAGAQINFEYASKGWSGNRFTNTDDEGRFLIVLVRQGEQWVTASDPDREYARSERFTAPAGASDIVLQLRELAETRIEVRDEDGEPITQFTAYVDYEDGGSEPQTRVEELSGTAALPVARRVFHVRIEAVGYVERTFGPFGPEPPEIIHCELEAIDGLHGRVVAGGEPAEGASVVLYERYGEDRVVVRNGLRTWLRGSPVSSATVLEDGSFVLPLPESGSLVLRASMEGWAQREIDVDASAPPTKVEMFLTQGGSIEGRVHGPRGVDPAGSIVLVQRGVGQPLSERVGPDGHFSFKRLIPGDWEVRLAESEVNNNSVSITSSSTDDPPPFPWNCVVIDDRTTVHDLDLSDLDDRTVRGRFITPALLEPGWTATLWPTMTLGLFHREELPFAVVSPDGSFELSTPLRGSVRLVLRSAAGTMVSQSLDIADDDIDWSWSWTGGGLTGTASEIPDEVETPFYLVTRSGDVTVCVPLRPDEFGHFRLDDVPVGRGRIVRWSPGHEGASPWLWETVQEVDVEAGRSATADW